MFDPFANQVTLQLGHGSDDRKHDLAHRAVDLVLDADNADVLEIETLERPHQVGHSPGEAIGLPDEPRPRTRDCGVRGSASEICIFFEEFSSVKTCSK